MEQFRIVTLPWTICTPSRLPDTLKISRPSSTTISFAPTVLTVMPFVPETSTPASTAIARIVMGCESVTAPNPPESNVLISPPDWIVLLRAPANVLHGADRLHGLTFAGALSKTIQSGGEINTLD